MSTKIGCWAAPGKPNFKHCLVQDRLDVVFFADSVNYSGNAADFFSEARIYFQKKQRNVKVGNGKTLKEIIEGMNAAKQAAGKFPLGDVHIVAHGTDTAWLMLAIPRGMAGPTVEEDDIWYADGVTKYGLTVLDLLRIFRLQLDDKFPRLDAGVVDRFTRIIVYSCDLGNTPHMLDAISDVLGYSAKPLPKGADAPHVAPEVIAPTAWVFFRRPQVGAAPEIRLFDKIKYAAIPALVTQPATFAPSTATQASIATQLKAIYSGKDSQIDNAVQTSKPWKQGSPADNWVELRPFAVASPSGFQPYAFAPTVAADPTGALSFISKKAELVDDEGFVLPASQQTVPISGITEREVNTRSKEICSQIFKTIGNDKPWWDLSYWNVDPVVVSTIPGQAAQAANPFQGTSAVPYIPTQYKLTTKLQATLVSYFIMRVEGGNPVPFDPNGATFVRSTRASRTRDYYPVDKYRNFDAIAEAGKALRLSRNSY